MKIAAIDAIHLRIEDPNVGFFDGSYDDGLIVVSRSIRSRPSARLSSWPPRSSSFGIIRAFDPLR
jgi:hypothetical protein